MKKIILLSVTFYNFFSENSKNEQHSENSKNEQHSENSKNEQHSENSKNEQHSENSKNEKQLCRLESFVEPKRQLGDFVKSNQSVRAAEILLKKISK